MYAVDVKIVGAMHRAGVPLLAGTDSGNPYVYPGFAIHDELGELVGAGLTPHDALVAATLSPARYLGVERSMGTIEVGKVADLVLLGADPLADIANTRTIVAVVSRGEWLDRAALDGMLADAAAHVAAISAR
jgi:imidazolonepropionase-like amidohydrolase